MFTDERVKELCILTSTVWRLAWCTQTDQRNLLAPLPLRNLLLVNRPNWPFARCGADYFQFWCRWVIPPLYDRQCGVVCWLVVPGTKLVHVTIRRACTAVSMQHASKNRKSVDCSAGLTLYFRSFSDVSGDLMFYCCAFSTARRSTCNPRSGALV